MSLFISECKCYPCWIRVSEISVGCQEIFSEALDLVKPYVVWRNITVDSDKPSCWVNLTKVHAYCMYIEYGLVSINMDSRCNVNLKLHNSSEHVEWKIPSWSWTTQPLENSASRPIQNGAYPACRCCRCVEVFTCHGAVVLCGRGHRQWDQCDSLLSSV